MSAELAKVLGFEQRAFKPGTYAAPKSFDFEYYDTLGSDAQFRMELARFDDIRIEIPEPVQYDMNLLFKEISHAIANKGFVVVLTHFDGYVRMEMDFSEKLFRVKFPPVIKKYFGVKKDHIFGESLKNIILRTKEDAEETKSPSEDGKTSERLNCAFYNWRRLNCSICTHR
jgi:hypothetical protein